MTDRSRGGRSRGGSSSGDSSRGDPDSDGGSARPTGESASPTDEPGAGAATPPQQPGWHDDPLMRPASDAGWDAAPPPLAASPPAASPPATSAPARTTPSSTTPERATRALRTTPDGGLLPTPAGASRPTQIGAAKPTPAGAPRLTPSGPALPSPAPPSPTLAGAIATRSPAPFTTSPSPSPTSTAGPAPGQTVATQEADHDGPLLPPSHDDNDLRSAVGATPLPAPASASTRTRRAPSEHDDSDDDLPRQPRNRKLVMVSALSIAGGLAIAVLVFLGHVNSDRYFLACEAERAVAQQGRSFPPWGTHALDGEAWAPLKISAETRCQAQEADDVLALERLYLAMILDQATGLLTAREVTKIDDADALLKQALLLTRPADQESTQLAGERNEHHKDVLRLIGDVTYWRASAKLRDAAAALADAAKQFDSAAAQRPRHVTDAAAWAGYARKLADELRAGPTAAAAALAAPSAPAAAERPHAPAGIALPVEPARPAATAPAPARPALGTPPAAPPPDAGVPTGGVLL